MKVFASQIFSNAAVTRGLFGLITLSLLAACVSSSYTRTNADTIIAEQLLPVSATRYSAQTLNFGKQRNPSAKQARVPISVRQQGVNLSTSIKEINFIRSRQGFSDSGYKNQTFKTEKSMYFYVDGDIDSAALVTPLGASESSTIKNKRMRGKPSLIWKNRNYLSLGGRLAPPQEGRSLACNYGDSYSNGCTLYVNAKPDPMFKYFFKESYGDGRITRESFLKKLPAILAKYDIFKPTRSAITPDNSNVDITVVARDRLLKSRIESQPGSLALHVETGYQTHYFDKDSALASLPKKYRYLGEKWLQPKSYSIRLKSNGKNINQILHYFDTNKLLQEITRIESLGHGYIRLTANMDKVDVYIDGVRRGAMQDGKPFVSKLLEGRHTIQARKDFFGSSTVIVDIEADDAIPHHFDLRPSGNLSEQLSQGKIIQSTGVLVVATTRNDVKIVISGVERIPPTKMPKMPSGRHLMKVITPQGTQTLEILVKGNTKTLINLDQRLNW